MHVNNSLADRQFVGVFGNAENSTLLDLCDIDNDEVGCQQLCVLVRAGHRQCACSVGFYLADDQRSCISGSLAIILLTIIQFIIIIIIIAVESLGPLSETACQFLKDLGRSVSAQSGDERVPSSSTGYRFSFNDSTTVSSRQTTWANGHSSVYIFLTDFLFPRPRYQRCLGQFKK